MVVYIPAFLLALVITNKARKERSTKKSCLYIILAGVPFILVSGLRYYVGTDYKIYADIFNIVSHGGTLNTIERGYIWLNRIVAHFSSDYQAIMLVTATITIICYFVSIYLISSDMFESVLIWFVSLCFFESMNTVRQSLAISLFFVGIWFMLKKKWWWYFLIILAAFCFHTSAIILIFLYWIVNRKSDIKWHLWLLLGMMVVSRFVNQFILYLPLPDRYLKYFTNLALYTDFRFMDFAISVSVWVLAWYFHRFVKPDQAEKYDLLLNLQFIAVSISMLSGNVPMAYRILQYFIYIPVFLIPEMLKVSCSTINKRSIKIFFALVYTMQWLYYVLAVGIVDFIKYTSILSR